VIPATEASQRVPGNQAVLMPGSQTQTNVSGVAGTPLPTTLAWRHIEGGYARADLRVMALVTVPGLDLTVWPQIAYLSMT
jgi:hypothetical protein